MARLFLLEGLSSGSYTLELQGGNIRTKRVIQNVPIGQNSRIDFNALTTDFPLTLYREMCMGIGSPSGSGGTRFSNDRSTRVSSLVLKPCVVKDNDVPESFYHFIEAARSVWSDATSGVIQSQAVIFMDAMPSDTEVGRVLCVFEDRSSFFAGGTTVRLAKNLLHLYLPIAIEALMHENLHIIRADHVNDNESIMRPTGLAPGMRLRPQDITALTLKYLRNSGHELSETEDKD